MQKEMTVRICGTCDKPLTFKADGGQEGYICCDEYFHEGKCLDESFKPGDGTHYHDLLSGYTDECYYTEWEPEYITVESINQL